MTHQTVVLHSEVRLKFVVEVFVLSILYVKKWMEQKQLDKIVEKETPLFNSLFCHQFLWQQYDLKDPHNIISWALVSEIQF